LSRRAGCFRRPAAVLAPVLMVGLLGMCVAVAGEQARVAGTKIRFDVSVLDDSGRYGPPDGLRALHYEFCIPDRPDTIARVRAIDGSVATQHAAGRIGCATGELLCIGTTHQAGFRGVLAALSRLAFVTRIEQAFFE
jgi:hypothetical protein